MAPVRRSITRALLLLLGFAAGPSSFISALDPPEDEGTKEYPVKEAETDQTSKDEKEKKLKEAALENEQQKEEKHYHDEHETGPHIHGEAPGATDVDNDGLKEADLDNDGIPESHVYSKVIHNYAPKALRPLVGYMKEGLDPNDRIRVFVNKVWPTENPQETYRYYDFPLVCEPKFAVPQFMSLGQILKGDRLMSSSLDFSRLPKEFRQETKENENTERGSYVYETKRTALCRRKLTFDQRFTLKRAIDDWYLIELSVDSFPIADFMGIKLTSEKAAYYLRREKELKFSKKDTKDEKETKKDVDKRKEHVKEDHAKHDDEKKEKKASKSEQDKNKEDLDEAEDEVDEDDLAERMWSEYVMSLYANSDGQDDPSKWSAHRYFLRTHYNFEVTHSNGEVMQVKLIQPNLGDMTEITEVPEDASLPVSFEQTVHWFPNSHYSMTREEAMEFQSSHNYAATVRGEEQESSEMKVHWLGILNSIGVMLVIMCVVSTLIVKRLKMDFSLVNMANNARGMRDGGSIEMGSRGIAKKLDESDESDFEFLNHTGWKLLHADVFRPPKFRTVFASLVGTGTQLLVMAIAVILVGCFDTYEPGTVMSTMAGFYVCSAVVAGYVSGSIYQSLGGERWTLNIILTSLAFVFPGCVIWSFLNTVAIAYGSTSAVPFGTIVLMLALWSCITVPLTILGGIVGRQIAIKRHLEQGKIGSYFPHKINKLERQIPAEAKTWERSALVQYVVCGGVPFIACGAEVHYIFDSVWSNGQSYHVYGILLLCFFFTLAIAALLAILFTYFQLNAENHRWWWRSFGSGFSLAFSFYLYSICYFGESLMHSFLQSSFFLLYSLLLAYGVGLMVGSITYFACSAFTHCIYSRVKSD